MLVTVVACCVAILSFGAASAQDADGFVNREHQLKALFLYNFGTYIEWPADAFANEKAPFVIGILGASPVDELLRQIATTKKIAGRTIAVENYATPRDVKVCHILFIARNVPPKDQHAKFAAHEGRAVLVVGETDGFASDGGCANFYVQANKIRFEFNLAAIKEQQLKVSSKLLALAKITGAPPESVNR